MTRHAEIMPITLGHRRGAMTVYRWPAANPRGRVICLHGLGAGAADFAVLAGHLNETGFDVICPDWIGHGKSSFLGAPDAYAPHQFVRCLVQVVGRYGDRGPVHLLGSSFGGVVLFMYLVATQYPARSATIIDIPLFQQPALAEQFAVIRQMMALRHATLEEAEAAHLSFRPSLRGEPEGLRDFLREARYGRIGEHFGLRCDPSILGSGLMDAATKFDFRPQIARLPAPTLFYYGKDSEYRHPALFETLATRYPHIRYAEASDAGHPPSLATRQMTAPLVQYIDAAGDRPVVTRRPGLDVLSGPQNP